MLLSTHPYVIDTLIALAAESHLLNNGEEALALASLEDKRAAAIGGDVPAVEHVVRGDDRPGAVAQVEGVLPVQRMTNPLALEVIYGERTHRGEVKRRVARKRQERGREREAGIFSAGWLGLTLVVIDVTRARAQVRDHDQQVDDACVPGHLRVAIARSRVSQGHTGCARSGREQRRHGKRAAAPRADYFRGFQRRRLDGADRRDVVTHQMRHPSVPAGGGDPSVVDRRRCLREGRYRSRDRDLDGKLRFAGRRAGEKRKKISLETIK